MNKITCTDPAQNLTDIWFCSFRGINSLNKGTILTSFILPSFLGLSKEYVTVHLKTSAPTRMYSLQHAIVQRELSGVCQVNK